MVRGIRDSSVEEEVLSPNLSVRVCTRMALCLLLNPSRSCMDLFVGRGVYWTVVLPLVSGFHSVSLPCLPPCAPILRVWSGEKSCSAIGPTLLSSRHPVASFAALPASLLFDHSAYPNAHPRINISSGISHFETDVRSD